MTDENLGIKLSALIDGECTPEDLDHLLKAMDLDPALKARYSRMCLARESLRGARISTPLPGFSDQVLAALEQDFRSNIVPFQRKRAPGGARLSVKFLRPLAGLAAAAVLGAVAILVLRPQASVSTLKVAEQADPHWTELDADNARRLNSYLAAHSQSRAEHGVGGTLSQARFTARPPEPQTQERSQEQVR